MHIINLLSSKPYDVSGFYQQCYPAGGAYFASDTTLELDSTFYPFNERQQSYFSRRIKTRSNRNEDQRTKSQTP